MLEVKPYMRVKGERTNEGLILSSLCSFVGETTRELEWSSLMVLATLKYYLRVYMYVQWLKKVSQCCVILKRLENCGISKRNQARHLQDGWKCLLLAFQNYFGHVTWLPWRQDTGILKWYVTGTLIWPYITIGILVLCMPFLCLYHCLKSSRHTLN